MRDFKHCKAFETNKENWSNFAPISYRDLSDFQAWALMQAFTKIGLKSTKGDNCWYWHNGTLNQDIYINREHLKTWTLYISENNNLVLCEYNVSPGDFTQVSQFVIQMN